MAFLRLGYLYTRDGTFVTGHAPYRTYDEGHVKRIDSIVRALDSMDTFLHRKRAILDDMNAPDHESALIELDSKRIAVLKAGNRLFAAKGIHPVQHHLQQPLHLALRGRRQRLEAHATLEEGEDVTARRGAGAA